MTPIAQTFYGELEDEAANTRKMLEALPDASFGWQPHEKSMTLGKLAAHVAEAHEWIADTVNTDGFDFATFEYKAPTVSNGKELLALFDKNLQKAKDALNGVKADDIWMRDWVMKTGDEIHMQMPKIQCLRGMCFNHIYHHRAQLSVYLRLLDQPVPGMYGPSRDEELAMSATQGATA